AGNGGAIELDAIEAVAGDDIAGADRAASDGRVGPTQDGDTVSEIAGHGAVLVQADAIALNQGISRRADQPNAGGGVVAHEVACAGASNGGVGGSILDKDAHLVR